MLSALLIALREGLEAALAVGIVLVYLDRTGRRDLGGFVWGGVGLAVAASFGVAVLLDRWKVSEDGFEGLMMLAAGALVVSMIVWMNRVARTLKREIETRVAGLASREGMAAGWGLGVFVFLMVLREGAELVLILRAVELSSEGVGVWLGTLLGLGVAVMVGLFFFQGTLRIPIGKFFAVTTTILMVVAFQLALTGIHELSEAQWIASSRQEMALVGPVVRNDVFFFVVILGVALLAILREYFSSAAPHGKENAAEQRRAAWERRKQKRWAMAAAGLFVAVALLLTADFVYARAVSAPSPARELEAEGTSVGIPMTELMDGSLHFYSATVKGNTIRFLVIHKTNGDFAVALDACQICGAKGYRQEGSSIVCRNCGASIYAPSVGQEGGCNPIPVKSAVQSGLVTVDLGALGDAMTRVRD
jgi:high-affinity iron transporter